MTKDPDNLGEKGKGGDEKKDGAWTDEGGGKDAKTDEPTTDGKKEATPKEDLTKLDDNEKYLRALDEVGKIGDAAKGKGIGKGALDKKLKAIKSKYALGSITTAAGGEESVIVLVTHKAQNNSAKPVEVKLLSRADLEKEFSEAVADLEKKLKMFGHEETGAVTKSSAETAANETDIHFEVIDGVQVTVEGDTVVIKGDAGNGLRKMTSKPLAKGMEPEAEGAAGETDVKAPGGEPEIKSEADVTDADRKKHEEALSKLKVSVEDEDDYQKENLEPKTFEDKVKDEVELEMERIRGLIKSGLKVTANYKEGHSETEGDSVEFEIAITPNDSKIKGVVKQNIKNGKYPTGEDPASRTLPELWKDVAMRTRLPGEKGNDMKSERIKLAKVELERRLGDLPLIEAFLSYEDGLKPRPFRSAVNEDAVGIDNPHTVKRHVFGIGGGVDDIDKLAIRVCTKYVDGEEMQCGGQVGAYDSLSHANDAISKALRGDLQVNWESLKFDMITGTGRAADRKTVKILGPFDGKGTKLKKNFSGAQVLPEICRPYWHFRYSEIGHSTLMIQTPRLPSKPP